MGRVHFTLKLILGELNPKILKANVEKVLKIFESWYFSYLRREGLLIIFLFGFLFFYLFSFEYS